MKRRFYWIMLAVIVLAQGAVWPRTARAADCLTPNTPGCTYGLPTFQYQLMLTDMLAHPTPNVRPLDVDTDEIRNYSFYQVAREAVVLYDAPNGHPAGTLDAGFNYVSPRGRNGDWVEVSRDRWVPISKLTPTRASQYSGVLIDTPLAYPLAWVLLPTRPSQIPGQKPEPNTPLMDRYTRVNIFTTQKVGDWEWYLVGPGQWLEQRRIARVLPTAKPDGVKGRWVAVDLYEQVLVAYDDDRMVFTTLISSGLSKWSTNLGLFHIWLRAHATSMSGAMGRPDFYSLQAVPYVMFFDHDISLHGTYWHDGFGYRHSHGCVNMSISDARWMFEWTDNFYADTWVSVWSSGTYVE